MTRYFFHIRDGVDIPDPEGTELPNPDAARTEAVVFAGAMLKDCAQGFWKNADWRLTVIDENGGTVCALRFAAEPV
jgi:hypothetical protein